MEKKHGGHTGGRETAHDRRPLERPGHPVFAFNGKCPPAPRCRAASHCLRAPRRWRAPSFPIFSSDPCPSGCFRRFFEVERPTGPRREVDAVRGDSNPRTRRREVRIALPGAWCVGDGVRRASAARWLCRCRSASPPAPWRAAQALDERVAGRRPPRAAGSYRSRS